MIFIVLNHNVICLNLATMRHADVAENQHGSRNPEQDSRKIPRFFAEWQKAKNPFIAERAFLNVVGERGLLHLRCRPAGRC
uniref:Uncharacterized protein n=1 Tax=Serratia proteamaculans (strain 568) TaxID=399741 RepID=A8G844_SERP5